MDLPGITLVLQILHFSIAYFVMRRWIFNPALKLVQDQTLNFERLHEKVDGATVQKDELLKQQKSRWIFMMHSLYKIVPEQINACFTKKVMTSSEPVPKITLSPEQKQEVLSLLQDELSNVKS